MKDINSLSHTFRELQIPYCVCTKIQKKRVLQHKQIGNRKILRELCKRKEVNIITAEVCIDHVHMFVEIPPKLSISSFMGYLKGKSSVMIYEKWGNMKFKYRNRQFWCRGYYVDTVGKNAIAIRRYIENQLHEDHLSEQLTLDKMDPFTGSRK